MRSGHSTPRQRNKNLGYGAGLLVEYLPSIQGALDLIPSTTFIGSGNTHMPVISAGEAEESDVQGLRALKAIHSYVRLCSEEKFGFRLSMVNLT